MKKVIALTLAVLIISLSFVPQRAEAADNVLNIIKGYTQNNLYYQYGLLTNEQKDICNFLVGLYNMTYLGARGFKFEAGSIQNWSSFKIEMQKLGSTVMQYTSINAWASRMSDVFCNYISSCIVYAAQQNTSLDVWYSNLPSDFSIPYSSDMYDAWNNFYNDLSNDGITSFGTSVGSWNSGTQYDFAFVGLPWGSNNDKNIYDNFIVNRSPVLYTNSGVPADGFATQYVLSFSNVQPFDSLFIQKDTFQSARFGYSNITAPRITVNILEVGKNAYNNISYVSESTSVSVLQHSFNNNVTLADAINYYFNLTPFDLGQSSQYTWHAMGYYYLVQHVYLVDDINTLSNPVEVFNTDDLNVVGGNPTAKIPIDRLLLYIKQLETDIPFPYPSGTKPDIQTIVVDNSKDNDGQPVTIINNYYDGVIDRVDQAYTDPISVDDGMFSQATEYINYLWDNTKPLILYTKDLLEALTIENNDGTKSGLSLVVYAALTIGVAGGIVQKLLL